MATSKRIVKRTAKKVAKRPPNSDQSLDPTTRFVRSLDGDYFMLREAAEMLGVHHRTLRTLIRDFGDQELGPSFVAYMGKVRIYLYTREDIEAIREHLENRRTVYPTSGEPRTSGRPRIYTAEERRARQRKYSQIHYYRRKAEALEKEGLVKEAKAANQRADQITKELKK